MEEISCIFCNQTDHPVALIEHNFTGKKCASCALVYISPRPSFTNIVDLYSHSNAHITPQIHIAGSSLQKLYAQHTLNIIKQYCASGNLLEIGAGAGHFLDCARSAGFIPHALELNPIQAQFIEQKLAIPCEQQPLTESSFGNTQFDIIYHADVMSHLYDPIAACKTMYQKLKPKGYLVFETGNIADVHPDYYQYFASFQYPDHLFFFGEKSIAMLLAKTGFKLIALYKYNITAQLKFMKFVSKIKKISHKHASGQKSHNMHRSNRTSRIKQLYHYVHYFLRYKWGAQACSSNKPQTMIVVAQKQ